MSPHPETLPYGAGVDEHPLYEIAVAAARALWVDHWKTEQDERGVDVGEAGQDLMDLAPATPGAYLAEAFCFLGSLPESPWVTLAAFEHRNEGRKPSPEDFGHYAAMQSMGHGVSLADNWEVPTLTGSHLHTWHPGHYLENSTLDASEYF